MDNERPRQKLPASWTRRDGLVELAHNPDDSVSISVANGNLSVGVYSDDSGCGTSFIGAPVQSYLAAIRDAKADAVYESARRLVKHQPKSPGHEPMDFADSLSELTKLIESLEESAP